MWKREWWQTLRGSWLNYTCRRRVLLRFLFFSCFPFHVSPWNTVMCNVSTYKSMRDTWMWHLPTYFESFNAVPLSTRRHSCLLVRTPGHRSWGCWFDDGRSGFPVFSSVKREIYLGILFLKIFLLFSFFCYSWNVKVAKR